MDVMTDTAVVPGSRAAKPLQILDAARDLFLRDGFSATSMDAVAKLAEEAKPKLIIAGGSAYPRAWDFARFRQIADSVGGAAKTLGTSGLTNSAVHTFSRESVDLTAPAGASSNQFRIDITGNTVSGTQRIAGPGGVARHRLDSPHRSHRHAPVQCDACDNLHPLSRLSRPEYRLSHSVCPRPCPIPC